MQIWFKQQHLSMKLEFSEHIGLWGQLIHSDAAEMSDLI